MTMLLAACGGTPVRVDPVPPASSSVAMTAGDPAPPPRADGRLPPGVRPTRYALDLTIDPAKTTFTGRTRIGVTIASATRAVVLHGRDLTVRTVVATTSNGSVAGTARSRLAFGTTEGPDELVLTFDRELPQGDAELDIAYEAPIGEEQRGLFRVEDGGKSYAFSQFEPTDARRMFPCFDEPAHKTPFAVTLRVPHGNVAFTNGIETRRTDDGAARMTTFEFAPSQPLPTYVVAVAVGPLEVLDGQKTPIPLRVIATEGKAHLGKAALELAAAHLDLLAKYFDEPYPYDKLDLVAVPNFHGDGMENAGLITSREENLLIEADSAPLGARRELAFTIGHEVAHHWFGNMVTMQWWDEIWLKESFAQWIGNKIVDERQPEMKMGVEQVERKAWGMTMDALPTSRPIHSSVRTRSEISDYNPLIFEKGAPIIAMTEAWLGEDAFRSGLRSYMKKHRGGSVTAGDFFDALSESSGGRDVERVVRTFVDQSGVPVVVAELDCAAGSGSARDGNAAASFLRLRQEEYRPLDRRDVSKKAWRIPVCVRYDAEGSVATECTLLDGEEGRLDFPRDKRGAPACPAFVYPNAGEVGYYRVRLPRSDLEKLARRGLVKLTESERLGLAANAWADVWSGHLPLSAHLELLLSYRAESSSMVLSQMIDALILTHRAVVSRASRPAFARYVRSLFGNSARRRGWTPKEAESDEAKSARREVLFAMGVLGEDPATLAAAARIAKAWLADPTQVDPEIAGLALGLAVKHDEAGMFDRVVAIIKNAPTPELKRRARGALSAFDTPKFVERALDLTLDGTLKSQDLRDVLLGFVRRTPTVETAFAWGEKHFDEVVRASPIFGPLVLARVPLTLCSVERVRAVEAFLKPRFEKLGGRAPSELQESVDVGLRCAALAEKEAGPFAEWLAKR